MALQFDHQLRRLQGVALALVFICCSLAAFGHPEDELCVPGEDGMDPALCAALAEMNSSTAAPAQNEGTALLEDTGFKRGFWATAGLYVTIGIGHILPDGADHILFVLAIFLASVRMRALLIQISAFTVAHTVTLGLAATGIITPAPAVVEPLIAMTIAFVAVENLVFRDMTAWRPVVVFGFGLIHGLGFAGFFGDLGLPPGQFWSALIGFNVGVELGQLSVIAAAAVIGMLLRRWLRDPDGTARYRYLIVLPGSAVIGAIGLWWAGQRLFG
jgi:hypothetical protein